MTSQSEEDWVDLPLFAPEGAEIPHDTTADDTAALSALSHMIYDTETPEERSELHREQGNRQFKLGIRGYKRAISEYSAAIDAAGGGLIALPAYLNRANAHYHLGNFGYALADAKEGLKIDSGNVKALYRCAMCANALRRYEECVKYCDTASEGGEKALFEDLRKNAMAKVELARVKDHDIDSESVRILGMLQDRGIRIGAPLFGVQTRYAQTGPSLDNGGWVWPVMIVYLGDVERSDYLPQVEEGVTMGDLLDTVLCETLEWDKEGWYRDPLKVVMRFRKDWTVVSEEDVVGSEVCEAGDWVTVGRDVPLVQVLSMKEYVTPLFPVLYAVPDRLS